MQKSVHLMREYAVTNISYKLYHNINIISTKKTPMIK